MTPFLTAVQSVKNNETKAPVVSTSAGNVDYFAFQLATHHFNLKLMARGLKFSNIKFTELKKYYGLKGRTAADCLEQFEQIVNEYHNNKG